MTEQRHKGPFSVKGGESLGSNEKESRSQEKGGFRQA
jgi:hypothetical protein